MLNPDFPKRYVNKSSCYAIHGDIVSKVFHSNASTTVYTHPETRLDSIDTYTINVKLQQMGLDVRRWSGLNILDVCCGTGYLSYHLLRLNPDMRITLLDINASELERARQILAPVKCRVAPKYVEANIVTSPVEEKYDVIIGNSYLHHFTDVGATIRHLAERINPDGHLVSLHEPTSVALGWEVSDALLALEIFEGGEATAENMRTTADTPRQTTDVWVFTHEDLRKIFRQAGYLNLRTFPSAAACTLFTAGKGYHQLPLEQQHSLRKKYFDLDVSLSKTLPEDFFGSCAISGQVLLADHSGWLRSFFKPC